MQRDGKTAKRRRQMWRPNNTTGEAPYETQSQTVAVYSVGSAVADYSLAGTAEEVIPKGPTVLLILDGYGVIDETEHNAIALADTPVMDRLMKECPFATGDPQLFGIARFRGLWYALVGI